MSQFASSRGRPARRFPAKQIGVHLPLQLLQEAKVLARVNSFSLTGLVQAALCRLLDERGKSIPEDVEVFWQKSRCPEFEKDWKAFQRWKAEIRDLDTAAKAAEQAREIAEAAAKRERIRAERAAVWEANRRAEEKARILARAEEEQETGSGVAGSGVAGSGVAGSAVAGSGVAGSAVAGSAVAGSFVARADSAPGNGAGSKGAGDAATSQSPAIPADPGQALDPLEIL
jgi:hypothetical protein